MVMFIFVVLMFLSTNFTNNHFGDGWYPEEVGSSSRWMGQNATFYIFSQEGSFSRFNISVAAYDHLRMFEFYVNDVAMGSFLVGPGSDNVITSKVSIMRGENRIVFKSPNDCTIPFAIENLSDFRCLSFRFNNLSFVSDDDIIRSDILLSSGWYIRDQSDTGAIVWMSNKGSIIAFSDGNRVLDINVTNYRVSRNVSLYVNNFYQNSFIVKPDEATLISATLGYQGVNDVTFDADVLCDVPAFYGNSTDDRCISIGILNPK